MDVSIEFDGSAVCYILLPVNICPDVCLAVMNLGLNTYEKELQEMLYELRVYEIPPLRMKDINNRFANHTTRIWKRAWYSPRRFLGKYDRSE